LKHESGLRGRAIGLTMIAIGVVLNAIAIRLGG
jgi:hypothetical protein